MNGRGGRGVGGDGKWGGRGEEGGGRGEAGKGEGGSGMRRGRQDQWGGRRGGASTKSKFTPPRLLEDRTAGLHSIVNAIILQGQRC